MDVTFVWSDVLSVATTLFFIMDSLGNIPAFQAILKNIDVRTRMKIILRELFIALVVLLVFLFAGTKILGFIGLSQPSLNISGGILLFIIALRMVFTSEQKFYYNYNEEPFIVPLAVPLVAGPSTIAVLLFLSSSQPERVIEWSVSMLIAWSLSTVICYIPGHVAVSRRQGFKGNRKANGNDSNTDCRTDDTGWFVAIPRCLFVAIFFNIYFEVYRIEVWRNRKLPEKTDITDWGVCPLL